MKMKLFWTVLSILVLSTSMQAQKKLKGEGTIQYASENDVETSILLDMHVTQSRNCIKMDLLNGAMQVVIHDDIEAKDRVTLMNIMGRKIKSIDDKDNAEIIKDKMAGPSTEIKVYKDDVKNIAGYKCHKVSLKNGQNEMFCYVTPKITLDILPLFLESFTVDIDRMGGYPLQMIMSEEGKESFKMTAVTVSPKVDKSVFEYNDEGYELMTQEQLAQLGLQGFRY